VIDDLHWMDPSSAGMVEVLVQRAAQAPLVVLAGMRPGQPPAWASWDGVERMDLGGLAMPETAQLATIVARAALDADDARLIHERTAGNPLFIGETVRASIEDGTLELRNGRMTLIEPGPPRLPLTLRAVLGARIDGLDEPARDVIGVASVIGMSFGERDVVDLMGQAAASSALAHHSHPYFYDSCKTITVEGRVNSVQWKDPHTVIEVKLDDGTAYTVDWAGLSGLTRDGIAGPAQAALPFGARIAVTGNPIRTTAQIREHFPDFTSVVNPNTVDPRSIRSVGASFSWALAPSPNPPNCDGK